MECPEEQILNPRTNKCIEKNGKEHRKLIREGILPCPGNKVLNKKTGRCIEVNGVLYKRLVKQGIKFHDEDVKEVKKVARRCKNDNTFLYQEDVKDIMDSDLFVTPSGYCFSITELITWIETDAFNNKSPYDTSEELFQEDEAKKLPEELRRAVEGFFRKKREERKSAVDILHDHMDIVYEIGRVGRICLYNVHNSWNTTDSSVFEYSIEALQKLIEHIEALPKRARDAFLALRDEHSLLPLTVGAIIDGANRGMSCIHAVGISLIGVFINIFLHIERLHKVKYEPLMTGMFFVKEKGTNNIVFKNMDHYAYYSSKSPKYLQLIAPRIKPMRDVGIERTSLVSKNSAIFEKGKGALFERTCLNEAYMATEDTLDVWKELPEWRKYQTKDKYCFDMFFLIRSMTNELNASSMTNPFPKLPTNPFTRSALHKDDLIYIRRWIGDNVVRVSSVLWVFLGNEGLWRQNNELEWRNRVIGEFEKTLRYRRLNTLPNGGEITGAWVPRTEAVGTTERNIYTYLNTANETVLASLRRMATETLPNSYYYQRSHHPAVSEAW